MFHTNVGLGPREGMTLQSNVGLNPTVVNTFQSTAEFKQTIEYHVGKSRSNIMWDSGRQSENHVRMQVRSF